MGNTPLLPIPTIPEHPADQVAAYRQLLQVSTTLTANEPLLTLVHNGHLQTVTILMLEKSLGLILHALGMDRGLYSVHSLRRGGAMAAYMAGADQLDIKRHGTWSSVHHCSMHCHITCCQGSGLRHHSIVINCFVYSCWIVVHITNVTLLCWSLSSILLIYVCIT